MWECTFNRNALSKRWIMFTAPARGAGPSSRRSRSSRWRRSPVSLSCWPRTGEGLSDLERYLPELRLANSAMAYARYLVKAVWPNGLACFYPYPISGFSAMTPLLAVLALVAITAVAAAQARRRPYLPMGWFWSVGSLVPVIGLVPVGAQQMADRYTCWLLTDLYVAVAWLVHSWVGKVERNGPLFALPVLALVLGLAVAAWIRTSTWRDTISLWSRAIAVGEGNYRAHNNLGATLGRWGATKKPPDTSARHWRPTRSMPAPTETWTRSSTCRGDSTRRCFISSGPWKSIRACSRPESTGRWP